MALTAVLIILYIVINPPQQTWKEERKLRNIFETKKATLYKCGLPEECPVDHFAFHITSGAANAIGPKICFEDQIIMSSVKRNIGPGLNIVLINGETGKILKFSYFYMGQGTEEYDSSANPVEDLLNFMKDIQPGTLALVASFDDPATKLTSAVRDVFVKLGSTMIKSVGVNDGWVFAGAAGMAETNHFEKHVKNEKGKNAYGEWPEILELGGCFPKKM